MEFIEVNKHTAEKRRHTQESLSLRLRATGVSVSPKSDGVRLLQGEHVVVDAPHSYYRLPHLMLDEGRYIPNALPTGAWGFVERQEEQV